MSDKKGLTLKEMPMDVRKFVLKIQGEIKNEKCIGQYSMEHTVYKLLREHPQFNKILANEKNI